MAISILAYDLPGSNYTGWSFGSGNYKKERAVRRFLVDGINTYDKTAVITSFIAAVDDASGHDLHPQTQYSNGNLPMQEITIQKVGNRPADTATASGSQGSLYIIEAVYYYPL